MNIVNTHYLFQQQPDTAQGDNLNLHIPQPEQIHYLWQLGLWRKEDCVRKEKKRVTL